jgi:hypothetical protein
MRVKIAYTVEFEDVENEVKEIMQRALLNIEQACNESQEATSNLDTSEIDIVSIIQKLDSARRKLSKADIVISDCQEILAGYKAALDKIEEDIRNDES